MLLLSQLLTFRTTSHTALCQVLGLLDVNLIVCMLLLVIWFAVSDFSND